MPDAVTPRSTVEPSALIDGPVADHLIRVLQELSLARDLPTLIDVVRRAARALTGADGATVVLRDGERSHYVDEDAIAPLWKGRHFPLDGCVSGWVMQHRQPAVIPDVSSDARILAEAYRPTFVRGLAMVPIRTASPIGAIGNYWATEHQATQRELRVLQALADSTAIAIENVQLFEQLEQRVRARTTQLEEANRELEAFSYAVAHELRTPLNHILGFSQLVAADKTLPEPLRPRVGHIENGARRLNTLIGDLLASAQLQRQALRRDRLDLTAMARDLGRELAAREPERHVDYVVADDLVALGDAALVRVVLLHVVGNAWKFSRKTEAARVEIGVERGAGSPIFFVRDNGSGFHVDEARVFLPFSRFHRADEYEGTGVGLSTTRRIVQKHGGRIWVESAPGAGATFRFTLAEEG